MENILGTKVVGIPELKYFILMSIFKQKSWFRQTTIYISAGLSPTSNSQNWIISMSTDGTISKKLCLAWKCFQRWLINRESWPNAWYGFSLWILALSFQVFLKNLPPNNALIDEIMDRVRGFLVNRALLKGDPSTSFPLRHLRGESVSKSLWWRLFLPNSCMRYELNFFVRLIFLIKVPIWCRNGKSDRRWLHYANTSLWALLSGHWETRRISLCLRSSSSKVLTELML